jgi:hypothetical protein
VDEDYGSMSVADLEEVYYEVLEKLRESDQALAGHATELAKLTDLAAKGETLFVEQAIRWERITTLIEKMSEVFGVALKLAEELTTINWHYTQKSSQG